MFLFEYDQEKNIRQEKDELSDGTLWEVKTAL